MCLYIKARTCEGLINSQSLALQGLVQRHNILEVMLGIYGNVVEIEVERFFMNRAIDYLRSVREACVFYTCIFGLFEKGSGHSDQHVCTTYQRLSKGSTPDTAFEGFPSKMMYPSLDNKCYLVFTTQYFSSTDGSVL